MGTPPCGRFNSDAKAIVQLVQCDSCSGKCVPKFSKLALEVVCSLKSLGRSLWKLFSTATSVLSQRIGCKAPFGASSVVFRVSHAGSQIRPKGSLVHHEKAEFVADHLLFAK